MSKNRGRKASVLLLGFVSLEVSAQDSKVEKCRPMTDGIALEVAQATSFNQERTIESLREKSLGLLKPYLYEKYESIPSKANACQVFEGGEAEACKESTPAQVEGSLYKAWQPHSYEYKGKVTSFIASEAAWGRLRPNSPAPMVAFDAEQRVYRVSPKINYLSKADYLICGCAPVLGGGAAPPRVIRQFLFKMPNAQSFKGTLEVPLDQKSVNLRYTNLMPDGKPCPMPP